MAGLLGGMDPGMLGMATGLLQSSGRSRMPVSFGQTLSAGLLGGMQMAKEARKDQMQEMSWQLQNQKLKREMDAQEQFQRLYSGGEQPQSAPQGNPMVAGPNASVMAGSGEMPSMGAPAMQAQTQPRGPTLEQIAQLGGIDPVRAKFALDVFKTQNPDIKWEGGVPLHPRTGQPLTNAPIIPQTNQQGFSTTKNWDPVTRQFNVGLTPGGMDAFKAQQGASAEATARYDLTQLPSTDPNAPPVDMSRLQRLERAGAVPPQGGIPNGPQAAMGHDDIVNKAIEEYKTQGRVSQQTAAMARQAGINVVPSVVQGGAAAGVSPNVARSVKAQDTALTTAAEGDAKKVLEFEAKIPSLMSVQRRLDRMESLTRDDRTYAASGAEFKATLGSIGQALGLPIQKDKTANTEEYIGHVAELLKDRLASKDFGSGSGVSNLDMLAASKPLPELTRTSQGRMQIITALRADTQRAVADAQAARDHFDNNASLRGFRYPSEVEAETRGKEDRVRNLGREGAQPVSLPAGVKVIRVK